MNYLLTVNYDGTNYKGFQVQPHQKTIAGELERAIFELYGHKVKIVGSGRTDAGVHALAQKANFIINRNLSLDKMVKSLNAKLPFDIRVTKAEDVDDFFSARFNAKYKVYEYKFVKEYDAFNYKYASLLPKKFDIKEVKKASKHLIGEKDFTSFSSADTDAPDFVKTIYDVSICENNNSLSIEIKGSGFLRNMVRIIIGTLIDVGLGKKTADDVKKIIEAKDRRLAGKTAEAKGLFLKEVLY